MPTNDKDYMREYMRKYNKREKVIPPPIHCDSCNTDIVSKHYMKHITTQKHKNAEAKDQEKDKSIIQMIAELREDVRKIVEANR